MTRPPGRLIALEGIDGCGKSTQARLLADRLGALLTFEPGATRLGASLRTLLLDRDQPPVAERAEALLMAADRAQHVAEVVRPALDRGDWVVTDRFSASTLAYQGYGRGLDLEELRPADRVGHRRAGPRPHRPGRRGRRLSARARRPGSADDRMEREGEGSASGWPTATGAWPRQQATPWLVVDGAGPVDEVAAAVWAGVQERLDRSADRGR